MKKRTLIEELERIHTITYGKKVLLEDNLLTKLVQGGDTNAIKPIDDPTKADLVDNNVSKSTKVGFNGISKKCGVNSNRINFIRI